MDIKAAETEAGQTFAEISLAEAIIFVTAHTQRHIHQLKNILKQLA